ncbi:hypothetical protein M404DRAFT_23396 [Pisolithus tinctorius Marx 270]|uniref:Uncharacterized protein n=1 Tax=Pisolithus tinctorius Marx 270 TaxID=870435 RepID=A0A0C3PJ19_PISTI|nr:hypothetical protein M404DRAFT_23396 [Pisolithus tinctorius Marx 270]
MACWGPSEFWETSLFATTWKKSWDSLLKTCRRPTLRHHVSQRKLNSMRRGCGATCGPLACYKEASTALLALVCFGLSADCIFTVTNHGGYIVYHNFIPGETSSKGLSVRGPDRFPLHKKTPEAVQATCPYRTYIESSFTYRSTPVNSSIQPEDSTSDVLRYTLMKEERQHSRSLHSKFRLPRSTQQTESMQKDRISCWCDEESTLCIR